MIIPAVTAVFSALVLTSTVAAEIPQTFAIACPNGPVFPPLQGATPPLAQELIDLGIGLQSSQQSKTTLILLTLADAKQSLFWNAAASEFTIIGQANEVLHKGQLGFDISDPNRITFTFDFDGIPGHGVALPGEADNLVLVELEVGGQILREAVAFQPGPGAGMVYASGMCAQVCRCRAVPIQSGGCTSADCDATNGCPTNSGHYCEWAYGPQGSGEGIAATAGLILLFAWATYRTKVQSPVTY